MLQPDRFPFPPLILQTHRRSSVDIRLQPRSHLILFHFSPIMVPKFSDRMSDNELSDAQTRVVVSNRKARHDYAILESYEAGIALTGTEVKSLRQGQANLQDSYAILKNGEVWLIGMHISPYSHGGISNHDPKRTRKLLLHRSQIRKLIGKVKEQGVTLVPLSVFFKGSYAKIELAVARGKRSFDKREAIAEREAKRQIAQRMKRSLS
jgi:SsrA-binding protein